VGIQLLNRTERLWLFLLLSASNDDSSWHKKCRRLKTAFPILTSFRRARRGSFWLSGDTEAFRFTPEIAYQPPFSCWNARRKQVEGGHQWMNAANTFWAHHEDIVMCLSFNTKNRLKGETLHKESWCQPGEHPPTSSGCWIIFFRSSTHNFPWFSIPHQMEVPRCSQTHRDQVGTSNWVEALQILTHF